MTRLRVPRPARATRCGVVPLAASLVVLLATGLACGSKGSQSEEKSKAEGKAKTAEPEAADAKTADAEPADAKAPDAKPAQDGPETTPPARVPITAEAVGPLRADTDPDELAKIYPDCTIEAGTFESEGEEYDELRVLREGKPLMRVLPFDGRISEVTFVDPTVEGPSGIHVGETIEALDLQSKLTCRVGAEGADRILCSVEGSEHVQLLYSTEGMEVTPEAAIPAEEIADNPVTGLRWLPRS